MEGLDGYQESCSDSFFKRASEPGGYELRATPMARKKVGRNQWIVTWMDGPREAADPQPNLVPEIRPFPMLLPRGSLAKRTEGDWLKDKTRRRRRNQTIVALYKSYMTCQDCGDPNKLTFDHINEGTKIDNVYDLVQKGVSMETLMNEIEKCEVRCWSCHSKRHQTE